MLWSPKDVNIGDRKLLLSEHPVTMTVEHDQPSRILRRAYAGSDTQHRGRYQSGEIPLRGENETHGGIGY